MCHVRSPLPAPAAAAAAALAPPPSSRPRGPQIFTFDHLPEEAPSPPRLPSRGLRKRSRKVLYPRVVKRHVPVEDPNPAKRLLFILLTVVFCQILTAEEEMPVSAAPEVPPSAPSPGAPPSLEPLNLTVDPPDYTLDISQFLQQHPAAF
ncbi:radiation-inducible immediate-early gene IEX-1 [Tachyglossus aculeatus]|uniref:radiation-inducible immediate-early gene IEX-1 n=1 Tax=Tachyglossus aculeatus TaxID=9261 RepID=UPI0018F6F11B|nr:radiation-inducible immediate-early gene IEX-1 [Tachyglossus aculeatus]